MGSTNFVALLEYLGPFMVISWMIGVIVGIGIGLFLGINKENK